jgi:predicted Zn-dependent peptidase
LENLTLSDVNQAIKKYFDPKNMRILIYSKASQSKPQLEFLHSPIEVIDFKQVE